MTTISGPWQKAVRADLDKSGRFSAADRHSGRPGDNVLARRGLSPAVIWHAAAVPVPSTVPGEERLG